jgi:2-polyprenyl-3-methyl-5-hydroxy-6-metoxy-1,4-benzoquinol methylase
MPTSDVFNIVPILTIFDALRPNSVLDVGCVFGKYGVLLREYLDVWRGRLTPESWRVRLVGIDAFPRYRNPMWDYAYQEVHVGEAQTVVPMLGSFDAVLISDVIEHLSRADAVRLVTACPDQSRVVVVSTPRGFYPQGDVNENPYETHHILWGKTDFPPGTHVITIPV